MMDWSRGAGAPKLSPFIQPPLNRYFIPRPTLSYRKPIDRAPEERTGCRHSGVGEVLKLAYEQYSHAMASSAFNTSSPADVILERQKEKETKLKSEIDVYLSSKPEFKNDPFKTIFVCRLPYSITEKQLRREFEIYGSIKSISIVTKSGTTICNGYAFVEFEKERSAKLAYTEADGKRIDGHLRCLVDVERGRTVRGWLPRRLGGGLGSTRKGDPEKCHKGSEREHYPRSSERKPSRSPPRTATRNHRRSTYDEIDQRSLKRPHNPPSEAYRSYRDIDRPSSRYPEPHRGSRNFF